MALTNNTIPVSAGVVAGKTTIEDSSITDTGALITIGGSDKYVICTTFTAAGINAAIDQLGAEGGEVYLPEGTYVCTDATITIDQNNTTLTGAGKGTILDWSAGQNVDGVDINGKDFVVIQNIAFLGSAGGGDSGRFIDDNATGADNVTIQNCWFTDADNDSIKLNTSNYSKIIGNHFVNSDASDIAIIAADFIQIVNNTHTAVGLYCFTANSTTDYILYKDNIINGSNRGVEIGGVHNNVSDNIFNAVTGNPPIILDSSYSVIEGNTINDSGNGFADIKVTKDYNIIMGNNCYGDGASDIGIHLDEADQCVVTGNVTSNHDVAGIQEDSDCQNNIIFGNNCQDTTPYILNGTVAEPLNIGQSALVSKPDEITATSEGVAASVTTLNTEVTTNDDDDLDNVTLANGTSGQVKHIYCVASFAGDTWKITPATMCGGTQITFGDNSVGNGCTLVYADSEGWVVTANNGGTIS